MFERLVEREDEDRENSNQFANIAPRHLDVEHSSKEIIESKVVAIDNELQRSFSYKDKSLDQVENREHTIHHSDKGRKDTRPCSIEHRTPKRLRGHKQKGNTEPREFG